MKNPNVLDEFSSTQLNTLSDSHSDLTQAREIGKTVLVVDDNQRYRKSLCTMLGTFLNKQEIFDAENIAAAVELARKRRPKLALVDVVLGNENGIDCARALTQLDHPPRVVLITAYPDQEFRRSGREAGASALLDKKDLSLDVIEQILEDV